MWEGFGCLVREGEMGGEDGYDGRNMGGGERCGGVSEIGGGVMGMVGGGMGDVIGFDICGVEGVKKGSGEVFGVGGV